jgi:hypothetical protein
MKSMIQVQGFGIAKPRPAGAYLDWIEQANKMWLRQSGYLGCRMNLSSSSSTEIWQVDLPPTTKSDTPKEKQECWDRAYLHSCPRFLLTFSRAHARSAPEHNPNRGQGQQHETVVEWNDWAIQDRRQ